MVDGDPLRLVSGRIAGRGRARRVREWPLCRLRSLWPAWRAWRR